MAATPPTNTITMTVKVAGLRSAILALKFAANLASVGVSLYWSVIGLVSHWRISTTNQVAPFFIPIMHFFNIYQNFAPCVLL